jgi:hypothetical protein
MQKLRRYPGAQPFSDDPISRSVFFGRDVESSNLTDQILANRLVVVYAKSGIGKTSLLQAGTAQPLRDEGHLPLFVRVNNMELAPLRSVFNGVHDGAARWGGEYTHGSELSLWHFFKTVEFWQSDRLLIPVLVLDQFEELFTLHSSHVRSEFLPELGCLIRGMRPVFKKTSGDDLGLTDAPPEIRVVISLREDYLGVLDEAADTIPQILDHRFRLTPLAVDAAKQALEGPASINDKRLGTKPFSFNPDTVQAILIYLSKRTKGQIVQSGIYIEPFHLQLICQRLEMLAAERQRQTSEKVEMVLEDLGGEEGLTRTLRDFYKSVTDGIQPKNKRRKVRRLCEQYLISPEGRRLSLERNEIKRILNLGEETLKDLVDHRLLRSDQRADSWYYELSHDCLVNPILATRKTQGMTMGVLGLIGSIFSGIFGLSLLFGSLASLHFVSQSNNAGIFALFIFPTMISIGAVALWFSIGAARRSVEILNRYAAPLA